MAVTGNTVRAVRVFGTHSYHCAVEEQEWKELAVDEFPGDHTRSWSNLGLLWAVTFCFVLRHTMGHNGAVKFIVMAEWGDAVG